MLDVCITIAGILLILCVLYILLITVREFMNTARYIEDLKKRAFAPHDKWIYKTYTDKEDEKT